MSDLTLIPDPETPPLVVAEISANHNGTEQRFLDLIRAAVDCGADLVKFQTYTADTLTLRVDRPEFRISAGHPLWGGMLLHDLYRAAHTPWEWHAAGFELAAELGVGAFSSPFDASAVDFLEQFDPVAYKIASLEIGDLPLIRRAAATGRPVVISAGTARTSELARAVEAAQDAGASQVALLLCTSSYPAPASEANLLTIPAWHSALGIPIGLSDHTRGIGVSIAAVALGARLIERHFTLDRSEGGFDAEFSLEPHELTQLVTEVRDAWSALGQVRTGPTKAESESQRLRRSLWVADDVAAGDVVTTGNVRSVRPAGGMDPAWLPELLGRCFASDVVAGTPMSWELLAPRGPEPGVPAGDGRACG